MYGDMKFCLEVLTNKYINLVIKKFYLNYLALLLSLNTICKLLPIFL